MLTEPTMRRLLNPTVPRCTLQKRIFSGTPAGIPQRSSLSRLPPVGKSTPIELSQGFPGLVPLALRAQRPHPFSLHGTTSLKPARAAATALAPGAYCSAAGTQKLVYLRWETVYRFSYMHNAVSKSGLGRLWATSHIMFGFTPAVES